MNSYSQGFSISARPRKYDDVKSNQTPMQNYSAKLQTRQTFNKVVVQRANLFGGQQRYNHLGFLNLFNGFLERGFGMAFKFMKVALPLYDISTFFRFPGLLAESYE